jgi:hypothetical protein
MSLQAQKRSVLQLHPRSRRELPPDAGHPRDGDVVIARTSSGTRGCTIQQLPREAALTVSSRTEAVRIFSDFACTQGVDLWYREDGHSRLVARHRPGVDRSAS